MVRYGAARSGGSAALAKSNVATTIAASLIDVGVVVYEYVRGEVAAEEAAKRIWHHGCCTMSSIFAGAAAGLAFGAVGAVGGYLVASQVYQSCLAVLRRVRLAPEEAERAEGLCGEAVRALTELRKDLEANVHSVLDTREAAFSAVLTLIDEGLDHHVPDRVLLGLTLLAGAVGQQLSLASFEEFDDFMLSSTEPLRF